MLNGFCCHRKYCIKNQDFTVERREQNCCWEIFLVLDFFLFVKVLHDHVEYQQIYKLIYYKDSLISFRNVQFILILDQNESKPMWYQYNSQHCLGYYLCLLFQICSLSWKLPLRFILSHLPKFTRSKTYLQMFL